MTDDNSGILYLIGGSMYYLERLQVSNKEDFTAEKQSHHTSLGALCEKRTDAPSIQK
jgi:hypothetical protein